MADDERITLYARDVAQVIEDLRADVQRLERENAELRESLDRMVRALEEEGAAGDGIAEARWEDFHAARHLVGRPTGDAAATEAGLTALRPTEPRGER